MFLHGLMCAHEEPGSVVLKEEVEMFSSIRPGRIKLSRLLIATAIVLVLLLSLDHLLYLAERRYQEEFISETEPVAGQGEFPTNGSIFRYKVMTRKYYMMIYWAEVWRDGKLEPQISEAFYYMPGRELHLEHYLRFNMESEFTIENGAASSSRPRWSWTNESIKTEKKTGLFYEGKWLKLNLGKTETSKSGTTISTAPDAMKESLRKAVCDPGAASNWVTSRRKIGRWRIEPGKIITLLEIQCGDKDPVIANAGERKRVGGLIYLKVRFDPITESSGQFTESSGQSGETSSMGSIVKDPEKYGLSK
jgi:hypothetical protein